MRTYNYFCGRRITADGFTTAIDVNGKPVTFLTKSGKREPVMMGVSEFGVPDMEEFVRGENHMKSHKVPPYIILWLPNAKENGGGITIMAKMYKEAIENPEKYEYRINILKEYDVPLNISLA